MPKRASNAATTSNNGDTSGRMDVDNGSEEELGGGGGVAKGNNGGEVPAGGWKKGDRVLCKHGVGCYEASIIEVEDGPIYLIHYQGWNKRYDERLGEEEASARMIPWSEEKAAESKAEIKQQSAKAKAAKAKKSLDAKTAGSSRGSTPSVASAAKRPRLSQTAQQAAAAQQKAGGAGKEPRKVVLPESLRKILVDDNAFININQYLPKVPAAVTVDEIVERYTKSLGPADQEGFKFKYSNEPNEVISPTTETCEQSALGLLDYFNTTIGSMLLYKFERPLYADMLNSESAKAQPDSGAGKEEGGDENASSTKAAGGKIRLSSQFGLVHFLRLFVRLGEMLTYTQWSARALDTILRHAQDFLAFLDAEKDSFYNIDTYYTTAPPEYVKRAFGAGPP